MPIMGHSVWCTGHWGLVVLVCTLVGSTIPPPGIVIVLSPVAATVRCSPFLPLPFQSTLRGFLRKGWKCVSQQKNNQVPISIVKDGFVTVEKNQGYKHCNDVPLQLVVEVPKTYHKFWQHWIKNFCGQCKKKVPIVETTGRECDWSSSLRNGKWSSHREPQRVFRSFFFWHDLLSLSVLRGTAQ